MKHIIIERATADQAEAIVHVHYDAVHTTASDYYSSALIDNWSPAVDGSRIHTMKQAIEEKKEIMVVAKIAETLVGFGSIVPENNELRAVYVHSSAGRMGVGTALLSALEKIAMEMQVRYLEMDASLNAESFYVQNGYRIVEHRMHRLSSGQEMKCAKMRKALIKI